MTGDDLVLSGVYLDHAEGTGDGIVVHGDHNRITECAVINGKFKFFVHLFGSDNRVDHCYLAGKTTVDPTFQIEVEEKRPNHDHVDHNDFGPRPPLGQNGGETMRVGYSFQSMYSSGALVEQNLYDRCDGEIEIISSKSCDNIYRNNTFLNCAGMLTLRHGNRATIDGNFFIGNHKRGSGGIRVIGEDHVITNNYIEGVQNGAFWITSGIQDSPLKGYFRAQRCLIGFNTIVDCKGPDIQLDAGMGIVESHAHAAEHHLRQQPVHLAARCGADDRQGRSDLSMARQHRLRRGIDAGASGDQIDRCEARSRGRQDSSA